MTINEIREILENLGIKEDADEGENIRELCVDYHTDKSRLLKAAVRKAGYTCMKFTTAIAKTGVKYVAPELSEGVEKKKRKDNRKHIIPNVLIQNTDSGKFYLRLSLEDNPKFISETIFSCLGKEDPEAKAEELYQPSALKEHDLPALIDIDIANIESIS